MDAVQKVKEICKSRKIPISRLEKDLGFANGYISQLRKGTFRYDRAVAIANYLGIPTSMLLPGEEEQKESPTAQEGSEAMDNAGYYQLNQENKAFIDQMIEKLLKTQSGE